MNPKTKKFKIKTGAISAALVLVFSYLAVFYGIENIDKTVMTSAELSPTETVIILDSGHGGMDGGCQSADGILEKGINLNIMLEVRDLCRAFGYDVEVTREEDISIHDKDVEGVGNQKRSDMDNRLALFNKYPNAVCVSIHQNKFTDPQFSGAQMFYSTNLPENERFARIMQTKFVENLQPDNTRETKPCGSELFLCHYCTNPTVMVECGFLSNPEEATKLNSPEYQHQVAFTIFQGITEFLQS